MTAVQTFFLIGILDLNHLLLCVRLMRHVTVLGQSVLSYYQRRQSFNIFFGNLHYTIYRHKFRAEGN